MKTLEQIKIEILKLEGELKKQDNPKKSDIKRLQKLRLCKLYLETNPSERFIKQTESELKSRLDKIINGFHSWVKNTPGSLDLKNPKQRYYSEMNVRTIKSQISSIDYLLG